MGVVAFLWLFVDEICSHAYWYHVCVKEVDLSWYLSVWIRCSKLVLTVSILQYPGGETTTRPTLLPWWHTDGCRPLIQSAVMPAKLDTVMTESCYQSPRRHKVMGSEQRKQRKSICVRWWYNSRLRNCAVYIMCALSRSLCNYVALYMLQAILSCMNDHSLWWENITTRRYFNAASIEQLVQTNSFWKHLNIHKNKHQVGNFTWSAFWI